MTLLIALALVADPARPEIYYRPGEAGTDICGVSASGPEDLINTVLALPGLELVERKDQYLTMVQEGERRFWTFAVDGHPAAPAIICRTIKPREGGGSTLAMEVRCFADKADCDKLTADFVAHNQGILEKAEKVNLSIPRSAFA